MAEKDFLEEWFFLYIFIKINKILTHSTQYFVSEAILIMKICRLKKSFNLIKLVFNKIILKNIYFY